MMGVSQVGTTRRYVTIYGDGRNGTGWYIYILQGSVRGKVPEYEDRCYPSWRAARRAILLIEEGVG